MGCKGVFEGRRRLGVEKVVRRVEGTFMQETN